MSSNCRLQKLQDWYEICQPELPPETSSVKAPDAELREECQRICDLFQMDYEYKNGICSCEDRYKEEK